MKMLTKARGGTTLEAPARRAQLNIFNQYIYSFAKNPKTA